MTMHHLIFILLWLAASGYAAARGGAPERIAAGAMFIAGLATIAFSLIAASLYRSVMVGIALTDFILFIALALVALFTARFWPMVMASMQACELLGHIAKWLGPDIVPAAYYATVAFWSYPMLLLLVVATWRHQARVKRCGIDHAWVHDLPRRYRDGWSADGPAERSGKKNEPAVRRSAPARPSAMPDIPPAED